MAFNKDLQQYFSGVFDERIQKELDDGLIQIPSLSQRIKEVEFYTKKDFRYLGIRFDLSNNLIDGKNLVNLCEILNVNVLLFASDNFEVFRDFYCNDFNQYVMDEDKANHLLNIVSQCVAHIANFGPNGITQLAINTPMSANEICNLGDIFRDPDIQLNASIGHLIKLAKLLRIPWRSSKSLTFTFNDWLGKYSSGGLNFPRSPLVSVPNLRTRLSEWLKRGGMFKSELEKALQFKQRSGLHYWVKRNELPIHLAMDICSYLHVLEREFLIELSKPADYRILRGASIGASDGSSIAHSIDFYDF